MRYQDLEVYKISYQLFLDVHKFSHKLPNVEKYELGSQVRRSSDSVNSNIVEGYGRKQYRRDYIRFLIISLASNDETINHLKKINDLYPEIKGSSELLDLYDKLGVKLQNFLNYVIKNWRPKDID